MRPKIHVRDNGIGIAQEDYNEIFAVFHRLDHEKYQGTGLGLAIAKKIMDIHNGEITVQSSIHGSVFTLHFPKTAAIKQLKSGLERPTTPIPLKTLYHLSKQGRAMF